jgi:hypothetical protein
VQQNHKFGRSPRGCVGRLHGAAVQDMLGGAGAVALSIYRRMTTDAITFAATMERRTRRGSGRD